MKCALFFITNYPFSFIKIIDYPFRRNFKFDYYCPHETLFKKVMGIKGRRVHMIEELSETIISFQRGKTKINK